MPGTCQTKRAAATVIRSAGGMARRAGQWSAATKNRTPAMGAMASRGRIKDTNEPPLPLNNTRSLEKEIRGRRGNKRSEIRLDFE